MMPRRLPAKVPDARGQVLVMAALMMVVLIGITGLAIDISAAYLRERQERVIADAAALAGGQDLQIPGSRALPGAAEYAAAKAHAMEVLVDQLDATSTPTAGSCFTSVGCALPGTPYEVSIQTPSPSHVECDPQRCIQVRIRQPSFGLTFARIFGFDRWEVSSTSVAGILQTRQYGLVTLRPPDPRNGMRNRDDISISGGSVVAVGGADVATNTNVVCDGSASGSELRLEAGFRVYHWDVGAGWLAPPGECFNPPQGTQLTSPQSDPDYDIPQRGALAAGCPTTSTTICTYVDSNLADAKLTPAECNALISSDVPPQYAVVPADTTCYKPGIYTRTLTVSANTDFALLTPGVYFFDEGLDVGGSLIGGYQGGLPGVAVVFPTCPGLNCPAFTGNNAVLVALNVGDSYLDPSGSNATAAEWSGGLVQTSATPARLMSILVEPDLSFGCLSPPFPTEEPANRCSNRQPQIKLPGGGNLWVAGVQYAPTDNTQVTGSSPQEGVLGQIISWTITFSGNSTLNLQAFNLDELGVLRLDTACSPTRDRPPDCNP